MALTCRDRIRGVLQSIETEQNHLPEAEQFQHYTVFELYRAMVAYREEIRLDKIRMTFKNTLNMHTVGKQGERGEAKISRRQTRLNAVDER
jgi:hypothetical protein